MSLIGDETFRRRQYKAIKNDFERAELSHGEFPDCKGLYPDCPENPSLTNKNCRTCPKTDDLKKPKLDEKNE